MCKEIGIVFPIRINRGQWRLIKTKQAEPVGKPLAVTWPKHHVIGKTTIGVAEASKLRPELHLLMA